MNTENQYFENHEAVPKLFFTSDGLAFFDEQNAINHAAELDDQTVIAKTREEVEAELEKITNDAWDDLETDAVDEYAVV
jgi:hypothetical protein